MRTVLHLGIALMLVVLVGVACAKAAPTPTPTPRPAATPTATPTAAPTATPTPTPRPTATLAPGVTPVATPTPTPSPVATPTPTPRPSPTPTGPAIKRGGELIVVQPKLPDTLDPAGGTTPDLHVQHSIYDAIESYDYRTYEFGVKYGLAESWEMRDEGKTFVYKLRKGIKFHGGETLTADDVKFTYERVKDPNTRSPWVGNLRTITSIEAPDPSTVVMRLSQANPAVRAPFDYFGILPRSWAQGKSVAYIATNSNGTSSWKLKEFRFKEEVRLEAFKEQGMGWVPYFDSLRFIEAPEPFARIALLQTGRAHILHDLPVKLVKQTRDAGLKVSVVPVGGGAMLWIASHMEKDPDTGLPNPWRDVRVRQAANYAVNKKEICDTIFEGTCTPLTSILPNPPAVGYVPPSQLIDFSYNPEKARQLLREAGYATGLSVILRPPVGAAYLLAEEANLAVAQYLKAVGIDARVEPTQYPVWIQKFATHTLGPISMTTWMPQIDAYSFLQFCCALASGFAWYRDDDFDKRFLAASAELDMKQRQEKMGALVKEAWDKAIAIYLYEPPTIWAMQPDINFKPPKRDMGRFWDAYREQR